jgi:hypothetical protein
MKLLTLIKFSDTLKRTPKKITIENFKEPQNIPKLTIKTLQIQEVFI